MKYFFKNKCLEFIVGGALGVFAGLAQAQGCEVVLELDTATKLGLSAYAAMDIEAIGRQCGLCRLCFDLAGPGQWAHPWHCCGLGLVHVDRMRPWPGSNLGGSTQPANRWWRRRFVYQPAHRAARLWGCYFGLLMVAASSSGQAGFVIE